MQKLLRVEESKMFRTKCCSGLHSDGELQEVRLCYREHAGGLPQWLRVPINTVRKVARKSALPSCPPWVAHFCRSRAAKIGSPEIILKERSEAAAQSLVPAWS